MVTVTLHYMHIGNDNKIVKSLALKINDNKEKWITKEYHRIQGTKILKQFKRRKHIVSSMTASLANIKTFSFQDRILQYRQVKILRNCHAYDQNIPIKLYQNMNMLFFVINSEYPYKTNN